MNPSIALLLAWLPGWNQPAEICPARELHARLLTPLASYLKAGQAFEARIVGAVSHHGVPALPAGSTIRGTVRESRSVGLGLRRDRASLDLSFDSCTLPSGREVACDVRLLALDNARESVRPGNRIEGILAASHPHRWLDGAWFRPAPLLFRRASVGLTGASGMVYNSLAWNPVGASAFLGARLMLFRMPEPELLLPPGTGLVVKAAVEAVPERGETLPGLNLTAEERVRLRELPAQTRRRDGRPAGDLVNFVFLGSANQVSRAFAAAGWTTADPLNAKTFFKTYAAVAAMRSYATAPVSPLHLEDRLPDLVFQKSFNSLARRHHIRIWRMTTPEGMEFWAGAATHDISIAFDRQRLGLTHLIDPLIDRERTYLLNDLTAAGCFSSVAQIQRPGLARRPVRGAPAVTDGVLLAARLRDCQSAGAEAPPLRVPRRSFALNILRRAVLEARYYVTRANVYYWAARGLQWKPARRDPIPDPLLASTQ